ncbi:MAG: hypothetical protein ACRD2L_10440 [Terriglobia bacterium]
MANTIILEIARYSPERNDQKFLGHSLVSRNPDGSTRVACHLPVKDDALAGERVYGQPTSLVKER